VSEQSCHFLSGIGVGSLDFQASHGYGQPLTGEVGLKNMVGVELCAIN
jgi:hypothetical protein